MTTGPDSVVAVLLGTDHHPFPRLIDWVERLATTTDHTWFVQHGATALPDRLTDRLPDRVHATPILGIDALQDLLTRAAAVVTHGGPGLIMEARAAGHHPIVVPRDPRLGEHVDDHQQRFCARIAREGVITVADDLPALAAAVLAEHTHGPRRPADGTSVSPAADRLGLLVDALVARRAGRRTAV